MKNEEELIKRIVLERIKAMAPNVKITLGADGQFLDKDHIINEVKNNTEIGQKIIQIQFRYLQALKEGLI